MADLCKIVVLFPEFLGDFMMLAPFLHELKRRYEHSEITIYTSPSIFPIVRYHPAITHYHTFPTYRNVKGILWKEVFRFIRRLRKERYDIGYFTNDELFWFCFFGKVKTIIRENSTLLFRLFCKGTPHGFLRHNLRHAAERHMNNLEFLFDTSIPPDQYDFSLAVPAYLLNLPDRLRMDAPYIVVNPDCHTIKNFERVFYLNLIETLLNGGEKVVVVGLKDPHCLQDAFASHPNFYYQVGKTTLYELMGFIWKSKMYIGVDSGPSHLACVFGKKALIFFPPKGGHPALTCGFNKESYSYKLPAYESQCNRHCNNYVACPYHDCKGDYEWEAVRETLYHVLAMPERSWRDKYRETMKLAVGILVIFPDEPEVKEAAYFNRMREDGYSVIVRTHQKSRDIRLKDLVRFIQENGILVVHFMGKRVPFKFRVQEIVFRLTEQVYMVFYSGRALPISHDELFKLYLEKLNR